MVGARMAVSERLGGGTRAEVMTFICVREVRERVCVRDCVSSCVVVRVRPYACVTVCVRARVVGFGVSTCCERESERRHFRAGESKCECHETALNDAL